MKNEKLYREAIAYAAGAEDLFLAHHEHEKGIKDRDMREHYGRMFTVPAATEACAQKGLIAHLFGVSEERVNEDVTRAVEARRELSRR